MGRFLNRCCTLCCMCMEVCVDVGVRLGQPFLAAGGFVLVTYIAWSYFCGVVPMWHEELWSFPAFFYSLPSMVCLLQIYFTYFQAVFSSPGRVQSSPLAESPPPLPQPADRDTVVVALQPPAVKTCRMCDDVKPARTHHCHICKTCVTNMDHHCPWIANCVGSQNYDFFVQFLAYCWLGTLSVWIRALPAVWSVSPRNTHYERALFGVILAASVWFALCFLLSFHVYLVSTAQSTIEFYENGEARSRASRQGVKWRSAYCQGSVKDNWRHLFGVTSDTWLWPLACLLPRLSRGYRLSLLNRLLPVSVSTKAAAYARLPAQVDV